MRGQIVSVQPILLTNMKNYIIKGSIILYLGVLLTIVSLILLGIVLITIDPLIGSLYGYLYMTIIFLVPVHIIELLIASIRKKEIDWISLIITLVGSGLFLAFFGGMDFYNPGLSTYSILYIPQVIWITLGLKRLLWKNS